jgi:hypothetical protein
MQLQPLPSHQQQQRKEKKECVRMPTPLEVSKKKKKGVW